MNMGAATAGLRVRVSPDPPAGWDALLLADSGSSPSQSVAVGAAFGVHAQ